MKLVCSPHLRGLLLRPRATAGRVLPAPAAVIGPAPSRHATSARYALPPPGSPVMPPRETALAAALRHIDSTFGRGTVMQLGSRSVSLDVEVIPTGSLALDHALGIGGLPRGRVVEIYGPESSGKTTLALHVIAEAQRAGLNCCFIDAEHALDPNYARGVGVDLDSLYLAQPDTGEQALEIADTLVRSGAMDVLVVDSVAALVPKAEIEGEMGDHHMALQARLMSQALRKLTASLGRSKTLIIFINQIRSKVGVIFGSPDVTPGGNALKFYSSVRLEIRRSGQIKSGDDVTGNLTRVKVAKNKLAPPFRVADFEMTYGTGINRCAEAVDLGVVFGTLRKSGAWYSVADPELLAAVNAAFATPAAPSPGGGAVSSSGGTAEAIAAGAGAGATVKGGKKAAAAARAAAAAAAAAAPLPSTITAAAAATAPPLSVPPIATGETPAVPTIALNEPFMQGRERMKEFFDMHQSVLTVALRVLRSSMRRTVAEGAANAAAVRNARSGIMDRHAAAAASAAPLKGDTAAIDGISIGTAVSGSGSGGLFALDSANNELSHEVTAGGGITRADDFLEDEPMSEFLEEGAASGGGVRRGATRLGGRDKCTDTSGLGGPRP